MRPTLSAPWLLLSCLAILSYGPLAVPPQGGGYHLTLAWRMVEYGLPASLAAWLAGETIPHVPGPLSLGLMAYQAFWVVGLTFMLWFTLVRTYSASKLSAFTFITPLFGVAAGYFIMHDHLTPVFGAAALLVIAGLYLVNKPSASAKAIG